MDARARTTRALIDELVSEGMIEADLDHLFALEQLLRVASQARWEGEELAAAVASLYAKTPESFALVERRCLALFADIGRPRDRAVLVGFRAPTRRARLWAAVRTAPRRLLGMSADAWMLALALVVALTIEITFAARSRAVNDRLEAQTDPEVVIDSTPESPESQRTADPTIAGEVAVEPLLVPDYESPTSAAIELGAPLRPDSWLVLMLVALASVWLGGFGLVGLWVPRHHRARLDARRQLAVARRKREAESPGAGEVEYCVERFPPFAEAAMDDVARILGSIGIDSPSDELDVERTLDQTIAAAGRPVPVRAARTAPRELLVLVDVELGDHPFLAGVEWLLARWHRAGLSFTRYDFDHRPDVRLRSWPERITTDFDALARRTEGMPLLLISRGVALTSEHDEYPRLAKWLDSTVTWPRRVFVDLDPRLPLERSGEERRALQRLVAHGFVRVPFTPMGLEFGALSLAGRQRGSKPVEQPLAPLIDVVDDIERWLTAVACVPDANWAQLEVFRRRLPELERALPDPRYVQRALEWVETELTLRGIGDRPTKDGGRRMAIDELADELIATQLERESAQGVFRQQGIVGRARQLLIGQLEAAALRPSDPGYEMWSLKHAYHQALLEPGRAEELLRGFLGGAHEIELMRMLSAAERSKELVAGDGSDSLGARVRGTITARSRVALADAIPAGRSLVLGGGVAVVSLIGWVLSMRPPTDGSGGLDQRLVGDHTGICDFDVPSVPDEPLAEEVDLPSIGRVCGIVDTALADTDAPMRLIGVSDGVFTMGAANHLEHEWPPHRVALSRFALCETEVSLKQYELVTGRRPNHCNQGCDDDHPVTNLTWKEATHYLNELTDRENERRPADQPLTRCYDPLGVWDRMCTGYRLPTEAEWEYAARAGTRTAYYFGDDEARACDYGNCLGALAPVGPVIDERFLANPWGFHGMAGNVGEFVYDYYRTDFQARSWSVNPVNSSPTVSRVKRGGEHLGRDTQPTDLRTTARGFDLGKDRYTGFRCARSIRPAPSLEPAEVCNHVAEIMKADLSEQVDTEQIQKIVDDCIANAWDDREKKGYAKYRQQAMCVMAAESLEDLRRCEVKQTDDGSP